MSLGVISQIALWMVSVVNLTLVLVLYRQFGLTAMASAAGHDNDGVPTGHRAPPLLLRGIGSTEPPAQVAIDGVWSIVMFGTPHCSPCVDALDQLNMAMPTLADVDLRVLAALNARTDDAQQFIATKSYGFDVYTDPDGATTAVWQVKVTPFVMLVDANGTVLDKALASTPERLTKFLARARELVVSNRQPVTAGR